MRSYLRYLVVSPLVAFAFVVKPQLQHLSLVGTSLQAQGERYVQLDTTLDENKVTSLFAWISRAFTGDPQYNNLMLAMAAIFGDLEPESAPVKMAEEAVRQLKEQCKNYEEEALGDPLPRFAREQSSLGAMGAGQWMGRYRTRPHALLEISNLTHVDQWVKSLPRGCRRTIQRAKRLEEQKNFTVVTKPILGNKPAPHSALAHFRCVIAHEVRLLAAPYGSSPEFFLDALSEGVSRYVGTTRMAGTIQEYRNSTTGNVIAIAHEVAKGSTIRGQWFYANDEAASNYVWFHSVYDLVRRSIETPGINVVDLGPSGSDAFSELKARYGFKSVVDWPEVANYEGPFRYDI